MSVHLVFVLRSGLAHYTDARSRWPSASIHYYDPAAARVFPPLPPDAREAVIIDRAVVTGRTAARAASAVRQMRPDVAVRIVGSPVGRYAEGILDEHLPPRTEVAGYLIAFAGPPGAGKSLLSRFLQRGRGIPRLPVGRYAMRLGPGAYGEVLAERERVNPLLVAEAMADDLLAASGPVVAVDGIKSAEQLLFLSQISRRPAFLFWVDSPHAASLAAMRADPDHAFADRHRELFAPLWDELRRQADGILDSSDLHSLLPLCRILERIGPYPCFRRAWGWDPFGTKHVWLDFFEALVFRPGPSPAPRTPLSWTHRRYIERYGLSGPAAEIAELAATGFRFLDDVLDEHATREGRPARWVEVGALEAVLDAALLTRRARSIADGMGIGRAFDVMLRDVLSAVRLEIDVEEGRAEVRTPEDWERAARREACFRAFLALLCGRDPQELYREGLEAQRRDDLLGATKHGREDTDSRLRRPLWQTVVRGG